MPRDFDACFRQHRANVYRWAHALCGQHADALDAVQEVFLRLIRKRPALTNERATLAWLRRVTAHVVIDRWRAERSRVARERGCTASVSSTDTPEARELAARLRAALEHLSEQQRLVVMAKHYDQMTFSQIADELGIAVPTAKTHYLRALEAVRARLAVSMTAGRTR
ncbi:MAG: sigma-70 family RNA polymerase sigma factor [Planctomycetes bacterium]|nr:sigma-70 family RNA polymerase sigma factor [Planctomycetota bacterium]